jgi:MFS transporter, PAT family, beta-lactamase induction signal transducer AmpG
VLSIPGLVMLSRFVPIGVREPEFTIMEVRPGKRPSSSALAVRGVTGGGLIGVAALALIALLTALRTMRETPAVGFDFGAALWRVARPAGINDWLQLFGIAAFAVIGGLLVGATLAARSGLVPDPASQGDYTA